MTEITVKTHARTDFVDITSEVADAIRKSGVTEGFCTVYVPHTTAGVTINENADPSVRQDIANALDELIPWNGRYSHSEGNSAAHVKATLTGFSVAIPIRNGHPALGTWQGVYFCEYDGPRTRKCVIGVTRCE
ncbi:MAG TPA: YjbQ family protein [Planctomycetes bacterium]|nr:YjbQ family protein [Planctomycetota bacterium]